MAIPKEFLRTDKIRAICIIRNLKTDECYLYASEDAVKSYGDERFRLDIGMHSCQSLQKAYSSLGLELFTIEIETEADKYEDLGELLEKRKQYYRDNGRKLYE